MNLCYKRGNLSDEEPLRLPYRFALAVCILLNVVAAGQSPSEPAEAPSSIQLGAPVHELLTLSAASSSGDSLGISSSAAPPAAIAVTQPVEDQSVRWKPVFIQSARFLAVQHGYRVAFQPFTRDDFHGKWFGEWFQSVKNIQGWDDNDEFIANFIAHPLQGSVTNYIFIQNHPRYMKQEFSMTRAYWKGRLKAAAFSAAYSVQFEIGPLGEAAIGNVGLTPGTAGWVDLVFTPIGGTGWQVGEDMLDRWIVKPIEGQLRRSKWTNPVNMVWRGLMNPSRSMANMMRVKVPWHRDSRPGLWEEREVLTQTSASEPRGD